MTNYNSQVGCGRFRIQFETDNREHYKRVQQVIRDCIDGERTPFSDDLIRRGDAVPDAIVTQGDDGVNVANQFLEHIRNAPAIRKGC